MRAMTLYDTTYRTDLYKHGDKTYLMIMWLNLTSDNPIDFSASKTWFVLGVKGSGKSSFLETIAEYMLLEHDKAVIDFFGSRDGEGLAWLRNKRVEDRPKLLLKSPDKNVQLPQNVKNVDLLDWDKFTRDHTKDYDITILATPMFKDEIEEYEADYHVINEIYSSFYWSRKVTLLIREASEILYSRKILHDVQRKVKTKATYLMREGRHMGITILLDTFKHTAVDADPRFLIDYFIIKKPGIHGIPQTIQWIYHLVDPTQLNRFTPDQFIIITEDSCVGAGMFEYPEWHKSPEENLITKLGILLRLKPTNI